MTRSRGFTLIELMVTLVLAGVLVGIILPALSGMVYRTELSARTNELSSQLALARGWAVSNGRMAGVCGSSTGASCDGAWSKGLAVWVDDNRDSVPQDSEIKRFTDQSTNVVLSAATAEVDFDAMGRRVGSDPAFQLTHIKCSSVRPLSNQVTVGTTGRMSMTAQLCP